jgi:hypothetical protein
MGVANWGNDTRCVQNIKRFRSKPEFSRKRQERNGSEKKSISRNHAEREDVTTVLESINA